MMPLYSDRSMNIYAFHSNLTLLPGCVVSKNNVQRFWVIPQLCITTLKSRELDSSVGIATRYGLEGPGIESRWGEIFRTYPDWLRGPPSLLYNGYRVFPGGKGGWGVMLTTHPLLVLRLRKSWAIHPLTLWVLLGLLRGSLYLYLTLPWNPSGIQENYTIIQYMFSVSLHPAIHTVPSFDNYRQLTRELLLTSACRRA
jgi:hypothetical protein